MGMVLYLRPVVESEAQAIADDSEQFEDFMFSEEADEGEGVVDFDKAWHAVHFLLTGSAGATDSPLSVIIGPGEPVGHDVGFGPPDLISPEQIRALRDALRTVSDDQLRERYNPKAMADAQVYLADAFIEEPTDESWEYVAQGLPAFRMFAENAASRGLAAFRMIA